MQTVTISHNNGHSTTYKITDSGTAYHIETPEQVVSVLEAARQNGTRLKIYYGDTETGRDWNEELGVTGRIGRSTGKVKIPLIIHNCRSIGGPSVLDHCIVKIKRLSDGHILYQHKTYQPPQIEITNSEVPGYNFSLIINGTTYSNHKTERQAKILKAKLQ
jgi:hypothetical protein